jgi:UDP-glucose 4-epimerase
MRIIITGVSGMIGKAAARHFLERGDTVVGISRNQSGEALGYHWARSDYEIEDLVKLFAGADAILHLAAMRPNPQAASFGYQAFFESNVKVTENVIRAAYQAGVQVICQASSISVYSLENTMPFRENENPKPSGFYGASKCSCEHLANIYSKKYSLKISSLRIARVLGFDNKSGGDFMLMNFIKLAKSKKPLSLWGEGKGARDTIYVEDVVAAFERAIAPDSPDEIYNIGAGKAYSHREIAETINEVFDNTGNLIFDSSKEEDTSIFYMDCSKAERLLGWRRKWSLSMALEDLKELSNKQEIF